MARILKLIGAPAPLAGPVAPAVPPTAHLHEALLTAYPYQTLPAAAANPNSVFRFDMLMLLEKNVYCLLSLSPKLLTTG